MKSFWDRSYEKVGDVSLEESRPIVEQRELTETDDKFTRISLRRTVLFSAIASLIALTLAVGVTVYYLRRSKSTDDGKPEIVRKCGNTAAEAAALGCTFDHLTWSWLSPTCPRYTTDDFLSAEDTPWNYYQDPDNRVLVSQENWTLALNNKIRLYSERREHITHCVYTFLSLAQILRDGTETHPKLSSYEHIQHCADVTLESVRRDKDWWKVDADMGKASYDEGC